MTGVALRRPGRPGAVDTLVSVAAVGVLAFAAVGCAAASSSAAPGLTVYAASSVRSALDDVREAYREASGGTELTVSADSSAALATQIEQGAPADVFLSADTENAARLVEAGVGAPPPVTFATNTLVVIVPRGNPGNITSPADLARPGLDVVAAGESVPITRYATELVRRLTDLSGYPADFPARYEENVVSREDNVRAVAAKIELGEGDAAIVYATDAAASSVEAIPIPDEANVTARYDGVVVASSDTPDAARRFLEWLAGPDGARVLAESGFGPP